jgi:hypothetical protein
MHCATIPARAGTEIACGRQAPTEGDMSETDEVSDAIPEFRGPRGGRRELPCELADDADAGRASPVNGESVAVRAEGFLTKRLAPGWGEPVSESPPAGKPALDGPEATMPLVPEEEPLTVEAIQFSVHVAMRYHLRRRAWYDRFHRASALVLALAGSSCAVAILGDLLPVAEVLSLGVAVAGAAELAFDFTGRARAEDALYRRFNALACDITAALDRTEAKLREWNARRLLIKADADDRLEVLRRMCHDLEAEARGYGPAARYRLWGVQRLFAQIASLPPLHPLGWRGRRTAWSGTQR